MNKVSAGDLLIAGYAASQGDLTPGEQQALYEELSRLFSRRKWTPSELEEEAGNLKRELRSLAGDAIAPGDVIFLRREPGKERYLVVGVIAKDPDGTPTEAIGMEVTVLQSGRFRDACINTVRMPIAAALSRTRMGGGRARRLRAFFLTVLREKWEIVRRGARRGHRDAIRPLLPSPLGLREVRVDWDSPPPPAPAAWSPRYLSILGALYLAGIADAAQIAARINAALADAGTPESAPVKPDVVFALLLRDRHSLLIGDAICVPPEVDEVIDPDGGDAQGDGAAQADAGAACTAPEQEAAIISGAFGKEGRIYAEVTAYIRKNGRWYLYTRRPYLPEDLRLLDAPDRGARLRREILRSIRESTIESSRRFAERCERIRLFLIDPAANPTPAMRPGNPNLDEILE